MTDRELFKMALDALDIFYDEYGWGEKQKKAHDALRARLEQPSGGSGSTHLIHLHGGWRFLKKDEPVIDKPIEWVGLTDEESKKTFEKHNCTISADLAGILARAIGAKLREKNT
jgi:hypothetical protein